MAVTLTEGYNFFDWRTQYKSTKLPAQGIKLLFSEIQAKNPIV